MTFSAVGQQLGVGELAGEAEDGVITVCNRRPGGIGHQDRGTVVVAVNPGKRAAGADTHRERHIATQAIISAVGPLAPTSDSVQMYSAFP